MMDARSTISWNDPVAAFEIATNVGREGICEDMMMNILMSYEFRSNEWKTEHTSVIDFSSNW